MRGVTLSLALLLLLLECAPATKVKKRLANQARFADTFSLLSKLNSNPYALNQVLNPPTPISLSQGKTGANGGAAAAGASGLGALEGLGGSEATTMGSDAAADAVSDSIKNLFNLPDAAAVQAPKKAPQAVQLVVAKPPAPAAAKPKAPAAPKPVKAMPGAKAPAAVKMYPEAKKLIKEAAAKPKAAPKPAAEKKTPPKKAPKPAAAPKKAKKAALVVSAPKPKVAAKAKPAAPQPPKPVAAAKPTVTAAKPKAVPVAAASTVAVKEEKAKEAELEAEVSELKAKIAKAAAVPAAKPKASPPVATAPVAKPAAAAPVAKKAAPVAKKAEPVAKKEAPVAKLAAAVAPKKTVAAGSLAHIQQHQALSATVEQHADAAYSADESDDFQGNFAPQQSKLLPPLYRAREAPAPTEVDAAPVVAAKATPAAPVIAAQTPVVATQTAAPAAEEMTMTMVPPLSIPEAQQNIITEAVATGQQSGFFGSVGNWFHTLFFGAYVAPPAPPPMAAPAPDPNADRPAFSKQDIERTSLEAKDDGFSDVAIEDDFAQKEKEDMALVDRVKREDRALRLEAQTPKKPSMPAPANFQHDSGSTHISNFWGTLAEEDADIESALTKDGDDLTEYERLKTLQDTKVAASVGELNGPLGEHLAIERRALRKAA